MATCLGAAAQSSVPAPVKNRAPLASTPYTLLPLTSVKPEGWLKRQLQIQAEGLSGHIEEVWPDLGPNSGWLGGKGESWERGPYYLDGLVPMAYELEDSALIARAKKWMDWTLSNQAPDGAIGPVSDRDWWPKYVMLKALTQYQEASGDARVIPLMERYFVYQASMLDTQPLKEWAIYRWQDEALTLIWLYNRTGDPKLLKLAHKLREQGYYWPEQFVDFAPLYQSKVTGKDCTLKTHGVNNAQGLKTGAIWWQFTNERADLDGLYNQFKVLDRYHLEPNGVMSADEHYAGRDPSQGTELCTVLETMYSLEHIIAATGDPAFADRLERVAYNPQPGTYSKDMWAHQYDQQANQVLVSVAKREWSDNGPNSNLYGLEPNFGCCTANMHQGWPKFIANLWMGTREDGIAAIAYGPSRVTTTVREGVRVTIEEKTEYPFREDIHLTVNPAKPAVFPLELRIPRVGRTGEHSRQRQGRGGCEGRHVPQARTQVEAGRQSGNRVPDAAARLALVSQLGGRRARAVGLFLEDWRGVGEGERPPASAGLVGRSDDALELWTGVRRRGAGEVVRSGRASPRRVSVQRRGRSGEDQSEGPSHRRLAVGERLGGAAAAEPCRQHIFGGEHRADPVWRGEAPDHGVSGSEVRVPRQRFRAQRGRSWLVERDFFGLGFALRDLWRVREAGVGWSLRAALERRPTAHCAAPLRYAVRLLVGGRRDSILRI